MYLNKTFLYGNLTRDPELKAMTNGNKVCSFSVATNRIYKDSTGNKKEEVEYHNIVVFGRQAENCGLYLKKGQGVMVEGRIQTRSWEDKTSGEKKYRTEVIADAVQFGPMVGINNVPRVKQEEPEESEPTIKIGGYEGNFDDIVEPDVDEIPF